MKKEIKKEEKVFIRSPFTKDFFICDDCEYLWELCGDEIDCPECGSYRIHQTKTINIDKIKDKK